MKISHLSLAVIAALLGDPGAAQAESNHRAANVPGTAVSGKAHSKYHTSGTANPPRSSDNKAQHAGKNPGGLGSKTSANLNKPGAPGTLQAIGRGGENRRMTAGSNLNKPTGRDTLQGSGFGSSSGRIVLQRGNNISDKRGIFEAFRNRQAGGGQGVGAGVPGIGGNPEAFSDGLGAKSGGVQRSGRVLPSIPGAENSSLGRLPGVSASDQDGSSTSNQSRPNRLNRGAAMFGSPAGSGDSPRSNTRSNRSSDSYVNGPVYSGPSVLIGGSTAPPSNNSQAKKDANNNIGRNDNSGGNTNTGRNTNTGGNSNTGGNTHSGGNTNAGGKPEEKPQDKPKDSYKPEKPDKPDKPDKDGGKTDKYSPTDEGTGGGASLPFSTPGTDRSDRGQTSANRTNPGRSGEGSGTAAGTIGPTINPGGELVVNPRDDMSGRENIDPNQQKQLFRDRNQVRPPPPGGN